MLMDKQQNQKGYLACKKFCRNNSKCSLFLA